MLHALQVQLTASVVFHTPLIRDLVSWAGFRQVCNCSLYATQLMRLQSCGTLEHGIDYTAASDTRRCSRKYSALQVARKTFVAALRERGSVMFVPGGQAELVHTHRASAKLREWVAYTGHKGA